MDQGEKNGGLRRNLAAVVIALIVGFGSSLGVASAEEGTQQGSDQSTFRAEEGGEEPQEIDARATKAAKRALFKARVRFARAVADHKSAIAGAKKAKRRADRAERKAKATERDMGNLVRLAYSSGDSTLNLLAGMVGAAKPTDLIDLATSAERITSHQEVELRAAKKAQKKARRLRVKADRLFKQAAAELALARADLKQTKKLAKSLHLDTKLLMSGGPVDLKTKGKWVYPVPGATIVSEAGWRLHPIRGSVSCHDGVDMPAPTGTAIHAAESGVVRSVGPAGAYGNYTVLSHGGGITSAYAHQSVFLVEKGDRVVRGQIIGAVGNTGLSTGAHLHFAIRYFGDPYNPRGWLQNKMKLRVAVC